MSQHHDPVHPDSDHLTAEVLADLDLGLLDDESAAHAQQHLTHCAACRQLRDDLATRHRRPWPTLPTVSHARRRLGRSCRGRSRRRAGRSPPTGRPPSCPSARHVGDVAGVARHRAGRREPPASPSSARSWCRSLNSSSSSDLSGGDGSVTAAVGHAGRERAELPPVAYVATRYRHRSTSPRPLDAQVTSWSPPIGLHRHRHAPPGVRATQPSPERHGDDVDGHHRPATPCGHRRSTVRWRRPCSS